MAVLCFFQFTHLSQAQGTTQTLRIDEIAGMDGYVRSTAPSQVFSEGVLQTGGWGDTYRTYVKFPVTGFPVNFTSVRLAIYCYDNNASIGGQSVGLTLLAPSSTWDQTITWHNQPASTAVRSLPGIPAVGQWLEIELTAQVQAWIAGQPNR